MVAVPKMIKKVIMKGREERGSWKIGHMEWIQWTQYLSSQWDNTSAIFFLKNKCAWAAPASSTPHTYTLHSHQCILYIFTYFMRFKYDFLENTFLKYPEYFIISHYGFTSWNKILALLVYFRSPW
jgi:hypothetical protein